MNDVQSATSSRLRSLLAGQRDILQAIRKGNPLRDTLERICRIVEANSEGFLVSILLLDDEGEHLLHGAAPSLPEAYCKAIHGISIGPGIGSCGTAAATGEPCIVEDVATHPNWAAFKALAVDAHGLRSCWSVPVHAPDGRVVATFAMYRRQVGGPTAEDRKVLDFASHLVAIAVAHPRAA